MIVLGIDPGLANTGYGVVARRGGRLVALDGGVVQTAADASVEQRLGELHEALSELLLAHEPDPHTPVGATIDVYKRQTSRSCPRPEPS